VKLGKSKMKSANETGLSHWIKIAKNDAAKVAKAAASLEGALEVANAIASVSQKMGFARSLMAESRRLVGQPAYRIDREEKNGKVRNVIRGIMVCWIFSGRRQVAHVRYVPLWITTTGGTKVIPLP
jgi:hypothetical protein